MTAQPLHMIGESHCLAFRDVTTDAYTCHAHFFSTIQATDYLVSGKLNSLIVAQLITAGVFDTRPPVMFFVGDMDLHQMFELLSDKHDFILPDDPGYGIDTVKQMVPFETVQNTIAGFLAIFFEAAALLRSMGLVQQAVHCLPPRITDSVAAAEWSSNIQVSAPLRSKLTVLANRVLATECAKAGIGFVDIWPAVSDGLYMKDDYNLDGVHLNRNSVPFSLARIKEVIA